jgi:hypothetical protein
VGWNVGMEDLALRPAFASTLALLARQAGGERD